MFFMQSISGVTPPAVADAKVMTVWPSVAWTGMGQWLGRLYRIQGGLDPVSIGRLALLATIPLGLMLYLSMRLLGDPPLPAHQPPRDH